MNSPISDLSLLVQSMQPVLNPGVYAFVSVASAELLKSVDVVASVREAEGLSAVVAESDAAVLKLPVLFRAAWITLEVQSDLQAIGLTAAFSGALSKAGIGCNVVAGAWHDHLFVPAGRAAEALAVLKQMQSDAVAAQPPRRK